MKRFDFFGRALVALALFALLFSVIGSFDYADALNIEAEEKIARPARVIQIQLDAAPQAAAPLGNCQHLVRGQWLYWAIEHRGDRMQFHHCEYMDWRGKL